MSDSGLTLGEAAELLSLSQRTVRRWVHAGKLPAKLESGPFGPQYRLSREHVEAVAKLRGGNQVGGDLHGRKAMTKSPVATPSSGATAEKELYHLRLILDATQRELQEMQRRLHDTRIEILDIQEEIRLLRAELKATRSTRPTQHDS